MKVIYRGCTEEESDCSRGDDPRFMLIIGKSYDVLCEYRWTDGILFELGGLMGAFNASCFSEVMEEV